jgi:alpha-glucosidase
VCVYQGEELGLTEADVPHDALRDPYGLAFWPSFKGRDGCRTPMPWTDGEHAGFSRTTPWLPTPQAHRIASVARQHADPTSTLNGFRAFMRWRKTQPALREGSIRFIETPEPILAFVRTTNEHSLLIAFNLSNEPARAVVYDALRTHTLTAPSVANGTIAGGIVELPPHGAAFASIQSQ